METHPKSIGKYKIETLIAKGGMGEVYKGYHPTLERFVIIKKLTILEEDQFVQRFSREARIMMDFKQDNIVNVYDHFSIDNNHYIVLEYVDGESLDEFIKREGILSWKLALYITMEVAKALNYAHKKGVVHRDIKPANILLSKNGEIKLVDFGIAATREDSDKGLTQIGVTLGTPSYMAPEQFENSKFVDKRADIYSLGVMLYEMVTAKKPFPSGLTPECIANIQRGRYESAKSINNKLTGKTQNIIKKLMHHRVNKRLKDLSILLKKLEPMYSNSRDMFFRKRISNSLLGLEAPIENVKKVNKIVLALVLTVILSISGYLFYLSPYFTRYFRTKTHGSVKISAQVNTGYYKDVDEIFVNAKLFAEDKGLISSISSPFPRFNISNTENWIVYTSQELFLPKGFYRLKLVVDGNILWSNFIVEAGQIKKLDFTHRESEPLPFYPELKITDQLTKKDLSKTANILIKRNNKFEKFNLNDRSLKTGTVQYFQISHKGYFTKDFVLKIGTGQTNLVLDARLYPKPGTLEIELKNNNIRVEISKNAVKPDGDKITLTLDPGEYDITFSYKKEKVTAKVLIQSEKSINGVVNYNNLNKTLGYIGF